MRTTAYCCPRLTGQLDRFVGPDELAGRAHAERFPFKRHRPTPNPIHDIIVDSFPELAYELGVAA
jgi:hypothetical protein